MLLDIPFCTCMEWQDNSHFSVIQQWEVLDLSTRVGSIVVNFMM